MTEPHRTLLRVSTVIDRTGIPRSTLYRMIQDGKFPRPVKLGERAVAWRAIDVARWCDDRPEAGA